MERVLIFDEDPAALANLEAALQRARAEFELMFESSSAPARARIEGDRLDVVVADVSTSTGQGLDVLQYATQRTPHCARIGVGTENGSDTLQRGGQTLAHRLLRKPCSPVHLLETLRDYTKPQRVDEADRAAHALGLDTDIGMLPGVHRELAQLFSQSDPSVKSIARIVEGDIGASAQLLKLVNSPWFGLPQRVTSVTRAVQFLGVSLVRGSLLLTSASGLGSGLPPTELEPVYDHCMFVGQIARDLAPMDQKDVAYTAGLLHDVGKIALLSRAPKIYRGLIRSSVRDQMPMSELERGEFGVTHAAVGAYLLKMWGIPPEIASAVREHHRSFPKTRQDRGAAFWVRVADLLVHEREVFRRRPLLDVPPLERLASWGSPAEVEQWRQLVIEVEASK